MSKEPKKKPGEMAIKRAKHLARARTDQALKDLKEGKRVTIKAFDNATGEWVIATVDPIAEEDNVTYDNKYLVIAGRIPQIGNPIIKDGKVYLGSGVGYYLTEVNFRGYVVSTRSIKGN